jgi:hypothetical protein
MTNEAEGMSFIVKVLTGEISYGGNRLYCLDAPTDREREASQTEEDRS